MDYLPLTVQLFYENENQVLKANTLETVLHTVHMGKFSKTHKF